MAAGRRPQRAWLRVVWQEVRRLVVLVAGVLAAAVGYAIFQVPHDIAAGGISGIGIIVNYFTGFPVGTFYLLFNIPLLIIGFFALGGWRFLAGTIIAVVLFSAATEALTYFLPRYIGPGPITGDVLLSAIYAGLVGGIGAGLIYAAGATMGGTAILGRIIQLRTGIPLSQVYLWVDGAIVITAGVVFGWELALYAMLTLLLSGLAADFALEGPSRARTAIIITTRREAMVAALMDRLERGVSYWDATGGYTGEPRSVVMCTIYRPQVNDLRRIVGEIDPDAFVSVGITQVVLGSGFSPLSH
ncbi:MAG TPA: YitT family protein [Caldilineaceae bacterium]|nr:YitT family protein [Caldilineaceae bacterium]